MSRTLSLCDLVCHQATISQLQAEVMQLQSAGAFWEREASLAAQLREAEELTASLQHTLQEMGMSTSSSSSQDDILTFEKHPVQQEASSSSSNGHENFVVSKLKALNQQRYAGTGQHAPHLQATAADAYIDDTLLHIIRPCRALQGAPQVG